MSEEQTPIDLTGDDADLEAVREALDDLRREIDARFHRRGSDGEGLQFEALFDDLRRRFQNFGASERSGEVDEFGMDAEWVAGLRPFFDLLFDRYWRVDVEGLDRVPETPCLMVANRSGLLPYDALMLSHALVRERGEAARPRFSVADWLMTLPFAQPALARLGGVRACRENVERLLEGGHSVIVFPEGVKGAAKAFRDRYRLQRFGRGGVIRVALETGLPIVPVGIVGAEEAHPILFKWTPPGRPLPFVPVTPTFPLFGPLGVLPLPTKWMLRVGEPLDLSSFGRDASQDELLLSRLTEDLRSEIQRRVDEGLDARESAWSA